MNILWSAAGIADSPEKYHWSSYNFYSKGMPDGIITSDPLYANLSAIESERRAKYIEYVGMHRPYEQLLDEKLSEFK